MNITWKIKQFEELTVHELYALLRLRSEVFVVEQNCVFLDIDNKDQASYHLMGWQGDRLSAYTRIVPPGLAYDDPSIGRVVTSPADRGTGIGKILMERSIAELYAIYGELPIMIGAQLYLKKFYESLGFLQTSEIYDEDGIDHIEMTRK
jgi:ElaA protein